MQLDLSGTRAELRDVGVTGATATTQHWRGEVALPDVALRIAPEVVLDARVLLDARDLRPLLAVVFGNDLPKIALALTDMSSLRASARVVAAPDELALLDLDAHGGDLALRGSYAVRHRHRRGALVAKKGFVSVGLGIDDRGAHVRLFGLDRWLRRRKCVVSEVLGAVDLRPCAP
jgi:hypothetical protein